ncbi:MAG TPA: glycosyltransferase family 2 protein [Candidatus Binataceae bacterium]|nr:glycosyltransferase family 2 protein [Candidatus Binataceae bacterium]
MPACPRITIVTAVFNEEDSLPLYEKTVREVLLSRTDYDFSVLFVDDGSRDRSWEIISEICHRDPRFKAVRFSRNFGEHIADTAGLTYAEGDAVAILACDLQDPPEVILAFLEKWRAGARIVWGRRRTRDDPGWRKLTSRLFLKMFRRFAMPPGSKVVTGGFLLADRLVLDSFKQFDERNRMIFALMAWTGFQQDVVDYDRRGRMAGVSGWTFAKMIKSMYDTFIGFSFLPVRVMTLLGITMFGLTTLLAVYMVAQWSTGHPAPGWTSIMLAMVLLFGVQFFLMGMVGEYLYRIYTEVMHRPLYLVSDSIGFSDAKSAPLRERER